MSVPRRDITELEYFTRLTAATTEERNCITCKHDSILSREQCLVYRDGADEDGVMGIAEAWCVKQTWLDFPNPDYSKTDFNVDSNENISIPEYGCINCPAYEQKEEPETGER